MPVSNAEFREIWDLTLDEAIRIALQNSKVIATGDGALLALDDSDTGIVISRCFNGLSM